MKLLIGLISVILILSILMCIFTYEQLITYNYDEYVTLYFKEFNVNSSINAPYLEDDNPVVVPLNFITLNGITYRLYYNSDVGDNYIKVTLTDYIDCVVPSVSFTAYMHYTDTFHDLENNVTVFDTDKLYIQFDFGTLIDFINIESIRFEASRIPFNSVTNDEVGFFSWAVSNIKCTFVFINNILSLLGGMLFL